ncbi:MAG: peptidoglycan-binding protein [Promethearchaeota archaeon]
MKKILITLLTAFFSLIIIGAVILWSDNLFPFLDLAQAEKNGQDSSATDSPILFTYTFSSDLNADLWCHDFNEALRYRNYSNEVKALQKALKELGYFHFPRITGYFGPITLKAVKEFQLAYKDEILKPWKLNYATGFVGVTTRFKLNNIFGCELHEVIKNTLNAYFTSSDPVLRERARNDFLWFREAVSYHLSKAVKYISLPKEKLPLLLGLVKNFEVKEAEDLVYDLLSEKDPVLRREAARALVMASDKRKAKAMLKYRVKKEKDSGVAQTFIESLIQLPLDTKDLSFLEELYAKTLTDWKDNQFSLKLLLVEGFKKINDSKTGQFLHEKFKEEEGDLKIAIAEVLGELKYKPALEDLENYLEELKKSEPSIVEIGDELIHQAWKERVDILERAISQIKQN